MRDGVFLFFGTKSITSLEIVDDFTRRFHMPYISPSLSRVATSYNDYFYDNFQISMKPPITQAIVDIIDHFNWDLVHYLYDSNEGKKLDKTFCFKGRRTSFKGRYYITFSGSLVMKNRTGIYILITFYKQ